MPKKEKDPHLELLKSLSKRELAKVQPGLDSLDRAELKRKPKKKKG